MGARSTLVSFGWLWSGCLRRTGRGKGGQRLMPWTTCLQRDGKASCNSFAMLISPKEWCGIRSTGTSSPSFVSIMLFSSFVLLFCYTTTTTTLKTWLTCFALLLFQVAVRDEHIVWQVRPSWTHCWKSSFDFHDPKNSCKVVLMGVQEGEWRWGC